MHEYKRFIQGELDARGWRQAELARKSGLSRQLISNILRDDRDHLGQMPELATLQGLAKGLDVPINRVRAAAARSIVDYEDNGEALNVTLSDVSTDALLNEIRKRIDHANDTTSDADRQAQAPRASGGDDEGQKTGKPTDLNERRLSREALLEELPPEDISNAWAARTRDPQFPPDIPDDDGIGEESQDDGGWG